MPANEFRGIRTDPQQITQGKPFGRRSGGQNALLQLLRMTLI